jgi:hypothetical protein
MFFLKKFLLLKKLSYLPTRYNDGVVVVNSEVEALTPGAWMGNDTIK